MIILFLGNQKKLAEKRNDEKEAPTLLIVGLLLFICGEIKMVRILMTIFWVKGQCYSFCRN